MNDPDQNWRYEGRANMREVTREEFEAYLIANPEGEWNTSTPVGREGPERYFIPKSTDPESRTPTS